MHKIIEVFGKALPPSVNDNFPSELIETNLHHINYYITHSTISLSEFLVSLESNPNDTLSEVAQSLFDYLILEEDLIPDSENGIYGFVDDAWLIHNMIYRCIEAGIQDAKYYSVDWPILIATDQLILNIIPGHILNALNDIVLVNLASLKNQLKAYNPVMHREYKGMKLAAIMGKGLAINQ